MTLGNTTNNKNVFNEVVDYIKACLRAILSEGEEKSEYELLKILQQDERLGPVLSTAGGDSLALYRAHFMLFHALYQLADELALSQLALLEISPLVIRCCDYRAGQQGLTQPDAVREYYLDWQHYDKTDAQAVDELLASFWGGLHRMDNREEALGALGLSDPVNDETIRKAYQRLVMQHHPDRGGDDEKIQAINAAVKLLLK